MIFLLGFFAVLVAIEAAVWLAYVWLLFDGLGDRSYA